MKDFSTENLGKLVQNYGLNDYQKALAKQEYLNLIDCVKELDDKVKKLTVTHSCEQLKTKEAHFCYCIGRDQTSNAYCITCGGKKMI